MLKKAGNSLQGDDKILYLGALALAFSQRDPRVASLKQKSFLFLLFIESVSGYVVQAGLELVILLHRLPQCQNYR
jgi:hypothetical protein